MSLPSASSRRPAGPRPAPDVPARPPGSPSRTPRAAGGGLAALLLLCLLPGACSDERPAIDAPPPPSEPTAVIRSEPGPGGEVRAEVAPPGTPGLPAGSVIEGLWRDGCVSWRAARTPDGRDLPMDGVRTCGVRVERGATVALQD